MAIITENKAVFFKVQMDFKSSMMVVYADFTSSGNKITGWGIHELISSSIAATFLPNGATSSTRFFSLL